MKFKKLFDSAVYGVGAGTIAGLLVMLLLRLAFYNIQTGALADMGMLMTAVTFIIVSFSKYKAETTKVNNPDLLGG